MRKYTLIAIGILIAIGFGQSWKGGNTAEYYADTICSSAYKLHRPGTVFPTDAIVDCCADDVAGYAALVPVVICGDTFMVPYSFPLPDTIRITSVDCTGDTSVIITDSLDIDTLIVYGAGVKFATAKIYRCDSTITAIDTSASPDDTTWCTFCDSIMAVYWYVDPPAGSSYFLDFWLLTIPGGLDTCEAIYYGWTHFDMLDSITARIDSLSAVDCAQEICFHLPAGSLNYTDTLVCLSVCDLDTLDLSWMDSWAFDRVDQRMSNYYKITRSGPVVSSGYMFDLPEGAPGVGDSVIIGSDVIPPAAFNSGAMYVDTTGGDTLKMWLNGTWEVK